MPFPYYSRLSHAQQRLYRQSDAVTSLRLPQHTLLQQSVQELGRVLKTEDRHQVEKISRDLLSGLTTAFGISPVRVSVLTVRPSRSWGELHGLYEPQAKGQLPTITVWMRTAKQRRVVAFRTYLRTLLHELCHHIDYQLLHLSDSLHTEGFYKRESSLLHQLLDRYTYQVMHGE